MRHLPVDREDVKQAVEIAIGDSLSRESFQPRAVSAKAVETWGRRLRRVLAELPPETTIQDLLEAMDE